MRNTLICTVGTSLLNNLRRSPDSDIQDAFNAHNWQQLSLSLLDRSNSDRLCGAEINSIASICDKGFLPNRLSLIFLVSDTDDGRAMGNLLKLYFDNNKNPLKFERVEYRVLEGLRDDSVQDFRQKGLKNLVREISTEVRKFSPEAIAINATGGYKAQISFAGMIGQALGIPVYYLFEKFSEVIELPPQPVALDLAFWLNNYLLFESLETENIVEVSNLEFSLEDPYLQSLLDREADLVCLSAMGILFNERSRLQFAKQETAILSSIPQNDTVPDRKPISLRDDHGKDILEDFSKKIRRSPYVLKIVNSLPFNPNQTNPIRRTTADGIVEFVLTWTDAGYGLCIQTTGRNLAETNSIAIHLNQEFAE
ncbi:putative CRISPR-associated protein [Lyngbya sp. CCY1209]|uniref:putative CRISPR-associated protein n=1 Tax=Lyngbya sp. CCY1209 TaxID=2886103 RepID=UPI002D20499B|nr:putative CRISPR-associated protein [Lyngbya sp. CCY1209]MEB3887254.1 putative CRISPR-associated protein [Lyngbya sp. CCY1209]